MKKPISVISACRLEPFKALLLLPSNSLPHYNGVPASPGRSRLLLQLLAPSTSSSSSSGLLKGGQAAADTTVQPGGAIREVWGKTVRNQRTSVTRNPLNTAEPEGLTALVLLNITPAEPQSVSWDCSAAWNKEEEKHRVHHIC